MAQLKDYQSDNQLLSDKYIKVGLPVDTWVSVALPSEVRAVAMTSGTTVIVQQATTAVVPIAAPDGVGGFALRYFQIPEEITHLHLYGDESTIDVAYINLYSGYSGT